MKIARLLIFVVTMIVLSVFFGILKSGLHRLLHEGLWPGLVGCLICIGAIIVLAALNGRAVGNADPDESAPPLIPEIEDLVRKFPGPITLNASRAKWWLVTVLGVCMTAASIFVGVIAVRGLGAGENGAGIGLAMSALGTCFFGLCTIKAMRVLRDGSLRLDEDGFGFSGLFRRRYRWGEVSNFGIFRYKGNASVVFKTMKPDRNILSRINTFCRGGRDGRLPDAYGLPVEELVQLMKAWQRAAMTPQDDHRAQLPRPAVRVLDAAGV
jgi:hypothetical protein